MPCQRNEGKTNDLLIAFIGYVNDLNKLQQFTVSVTKIPPSTSMHFSTLLATVRVALLRSSWRSCSTIHKCERPVRLLSFIFLCRLRFSFIPTDKNSKVVRPTSNSRIVTPIENWTHVYMNLFTRNSPYYYFLKYLLFLLKHPVCMYIYIYICVCVCVRARARARSTRC